MDLKALSLIQHRNAANKLTTPGPSKAELVEIFKSAMRAPDHARLKPWRFIVIEGQDREELGNLFVEVHTAEDPDISIEKCQQIAAKTLRAPLIVVVVAHVVEHPKVPEIEQLLSVGCAAQNILLSAEALDYAGIWRTGKLAFNKDVHKGLGLLDNEQLLGFLYLGTRDGEGKSLPHYEQENFVRSWPGQD